MALGQTFLNFLEIENVHDTRGKASKEGILGKLVLKLTMRTEKMSSTD